VVLDWVAQVEVNVAIIYGVPLVLTAAGRSRKLLWGLASFLILMNFSVYSAQIPPGVFSLREPYFVSRVLAAAGMLFTAGLLHVWMIAVDTTAAQSLTLKDQNEQLEAANRELLRRENQQALVAELGRRGLIGIALDQLMNEAVSLVRSELEVESCNVLELLPEGRVLFQAGVGWGDGLVVQAATEAHSAIPVAQILRTQAPVVVADLGADGRFSDADFLHGHGLVSSLNIPLYGHERPYGLLGAYTSRRRTFTDEDVHFVQSVANVLSAAIERKWLEQRQHEQHLLRAEQMMAIGQVAAGVAHELRNPLTSIKGLVQVNLREARAHGLPDDDLAVIEHEIRRMERTLQTFLDFARPPKLERRRLDPAAVVERVCAVVAGRGKKQGVSLRLTRPEAPAWLEADQDQLQQLLLNLMLNSLDAMPQGGHVEVELRPPRDGFVELQVRDTGPGIPAHILPKLFETFVSSKETGVGLGVAVSKRIAEDHGGSLSAYNLPEGGACFVLRLPTPGPS
jgi:signal transduction histidine kinase